MDAKNLWPQGMLQPEIASPRAILLDQARYLSEMTDSVLTADVRTQVYGKKKHKSIGGILESPKQDFGKVEHEFVIKAPVLGRFEFTLLEVVHELAFYPLELIFQLEDNPMTLIAKNEKEFLQLLKDVLAHPKTLNAINALVAPQAD